MKEVSFMKKNKNKKNIFGGIDLTWKKLILFAIIAGVYTAIMAMLPFTKETSFRDIAIQLECWIIFGIIIISNSKSPKDSALKCFIFFLISQPLVYLIQVPFNDLGFGLFRYYKYWFIWTLFTIPMGFIGYYIKKKNYVSMIILLPMLILLAYLGVGYLSAVIENFPHHLLSCMLCFASIIVIVINIFDKNKLRIIALSIVALLSLGYVILNGGIGSEYETIRTLDDLDIEFVGKIYVSSYSGTAKGNVEVVASTDEIHSVKLNCRKNGKYTFTISDDSNYEYYFEYYYNEKEETVLLKYIEKKEVQE